MRLGTLLGDADDRVAHAGRDRAHRSDFGLEGREFGGRRLVPNQQKERHFFEGRVLRQVGDLVTAINEFRLRHRADRGIADGLAGKATGIDRLRSGGSGGHG